VFGEAGYKLSDATWIQPDVSFLTAERVRATDPNGYFLGAPDLAVEIISPSEFIPIPAQSTSTRPTANRSRWATATGLRSPTFCPAGISR
jgi:hypothetical protein